MAKMSRKEYVFSKMTTIYSQNGKILRHNNFILS